MSLHSFRRSSYLRTLKQSSEPIRLVAIGKCHSWTLHFSKKGLLVFRSTLCILEFLSVEVSQRVKRVLGDTITSETCVTRFTIILHLGWGQKDELVKSNFEKIR